MYRCCSKCGYCRGNLVPNALCDLGVDVQTLLPVARSCVSCWSPQVPCVSGAPDQVNNGEIPIPLLHVTPPSLLPVLLLLSRLPTVRIKFPFHISHIVLLWFHVMVMLRLLTCAPAFLAFAPPRSLLLFALNLPRRLEAAADALTGVVNADLLHLLRLPLLMFTEIQATLKIIENLISSGRTTFLETSWRFVEMLSEKDGFDLIGDTHLVN
jgi:hypothetical protein